MKKSEGAAEKQSPEDRPASVEVFELTEISQLKRCMELQSLVWSASEAEVVPVSQLRAAQHAGGLIAGASVDGELIGFCYGFPSFRPDVRDEPGLHSHQTGVAPQARNRGVGRALKWFQREWCLDKGLSWVEWTFDPLRAANARLNLEHLGASAGEYLVDAYGELEDALNAGIPSDRLMAHWDLKSVYAERASVDASLSPARGGQGVVSEESTPDDAEPVLSSDGNGAPRELRPTIAAHVVTVAIPPDIGELLSHAPELAKAWRLATRKAFVHYLQNGYRATRFVEGAYMLERITG